MAVLDLPDFQITDPVVEKLTYARVKLLLEHPWFGQVALGLKLTEGGDWCNTAATDGRHLFYNRQFILDLTPAQVMFLVGHEIMHACYEHIGRRGHREPDLWNMAVDYIVNYTLKHSGVGEMPPGGLYDDAYTDELYGEELYEILLKNQCKVLMPLDQHLNLEEPGEGEGEGSGGSGEMVEVTVTGQNGPPKLSKQDIEDIRNELRSAMIQAAQQAGAGKVPLGIRRLIDELTEPKMDWRALLDAHIRSSVKDDYTFARLSRRTHAMTALGGRRYIMPGQNFLDTVDIAITIDASGSLTNEMLRDLLSEVKGIMETFRDFKIKLWSFDTQVYNYVEIGAENINEFDTWEPGGGGGTLFECNWAFMKEHEIDPTRLIMFTDGYPNGTWGDPDYCDTLFIVHGPRSITAPFGLTAHYDAEAEGTRQKFLLAA